MNIDPNGTFFFLTCLIVGLIAGAVIGGTIGGVMAYNNAVANGYTGWGLVGQTLLGVLGGAVIGGAIGAAIGAGIGAAAGIMLAGSATASTASVMAGGSTLVATVSAGGLGAGATFIGGNISTWVNSFSKAVPIIGQAHGSIVHKAEVNRYAAEMVKSGIYVEIYLNRSLSTTGVLQGSYLRPDIIGVFKNGGHFLVEVASKSQAAGTPLAKLLGNIEFYKTIPSVVAELIKWGY